MSDSRIRAQIAIQQIKQTSNTEIHEKWQQFEYENFNSFFRDIEKCIRVEKQYWHEMYRVKPHTPGFLILFILAFIFTLLDPKCTLYEKLGIAGMLACVLTYHIKDEHLSDDKCLSALQTLFQIQFYWHDNGNLGLFDSVDKLEILYIARGKLLDECYPKQASVVTLLKAQKNGNDSPLHRFFKRCNSKDMTKIICSFLDEKSLKKVNVNQPRKDLRYSKAY
jgi:hypothetical protein